VSPRTFGSTSEISATEPPSEETPPAGSETKSGHGATVPAIVVIEWGSHRDQAGGSRDRAGIHRDHEADRRDAAADQRDRAADRRDQAADARDRAADDRDQAGDRSVVPISDRITADALKRSETARREAAQHPAVHSEQQVEDGRRVGPGEQQDDGCDQYQEPDVSTAGDPSPVLADGISRDQQTAAEEDADDQIMRDRQYHHFTRTSPRERCSG